MLIGFVCTSFTTFMTASVTQDAFPPVATLPNVAAIVLSYLALTLAWHAASVSDSTGSLRIGNLSLASPTTLRKIIVPVLLVHLYLQVPRRKVLDYHPIDVLIRESATKAATWATQATVSKTIGDAVAQYHGRYGRYPPPSFEVWYEFAKDRSSLVIDDFDDMYNDLEPFWDLDPAEIRLRTSKILSDPWNEVADIVIRSGRAEIGPKILATHHWMLEGIIAMINPFALHLPDMDLGFNINDEPRVAVPYNKKAGVREAKTESGLPFNGWSGDRQDGWPLIDDPVRPFIDRSFNKNFYDYGSVACPPNSAARRKRIWDASAFCVACAAPHSFDGFLSNWTLSASPCHQPDLSNLHGFYLSPAAFKPSQELFPVFSQSKAHGYSDILYPSAWNYMDKAKYEPTDEHPDPSFAQKDNTLFWRGATSEGLSRHGAWKGMTRQRLVHLANNLTSSDRIPILFPRRMQRDKWEYTYVSPREIEAANLTTDIAIVESIARCWDTDCDDQDAEFGLVGKTDFQAHWRYRYLFDMDGAGFSGRFLPFLQSRSLPFKTALFREWYDSRLTAWKHFVPLDLRLHGVYSTLAYFAGIKTAKGTQMESRVKEGARMAEDGREWAGKVLRKEDMEIYMFRLLLEWGRLTDDNRDTIGYSG
jgi:hypothetical protein